MKWDGYTKPYCWNNKRTERSGNYANDVRCENWYIHMYGWMDDEVGAYRNAD